MMVVLEVLGEPKPLARARHGRGRTFDPKQNRVNKDTVRFAWQQARAAPFGREPIQMLVECFFPRPASHFGTGRNANVLKESAPVWHTKRPDGDNLLKLVKDALNTIAYVDDSQIVDARVTKAYASAGRAPFTRVTLLEAEESILMAAARRSC